MSQTTPKSIKLNKSAEALNIVKGLMNQPDDVRCKYGIEASIKTLKKLRRRELRLTQLNEERKARELIKRTV